MNQKAKNLICGIAGLFLALNANVHSSVTIVTEVAEITTGGANVASGTLLIISHGGNNSLQSNSWTSGTSFISGDDTFFAAIAINNGVASATLANYLIPAGSTQNVTQLSGIFINGLTSSDIDYSTGSLLGGKTFASTGGTSYAFGIYRSSTPEAFGAPSPGDNIGWLIPSDGGTYNLSAYSGTGDYGNNDINASLGTTSSLNVVPEPSTGALMVLGAAGLVALRRLRKV